MFTAAAIAAAAAAAIAAAAEEEDMWPHWCDFFALLSHYKHIYIIYFDIALLRAANTW